MNQFSQLVEYKKMPMPKADKIAKTQIPVIPAEARIQKLLKILDTGSSRYDVDACF